MNDQEELRRRLKRWHAWLLLISIPGVALAGLAVWLSIRQFLQAYLVGYLFWWSVTMGCLGLLMLYYLVGGRWGTALKPLLECGSLLVPLNALLFLPIAWGIEYLYPWATSAGDAPQERLYLNPPFFYGRAVFYFIAWVTLAVIVSSGRQQTATDCPRWRRMLSAGGLVLLFLSVTFASIDWAMSLDPEWFSTIYGALVAMGGALASLALMTMAIALLSPDRVLLSALKAPAPFGDLGSLLMAFLMLWAYMAYSQFLIIWSGNLPDENKWYVDRFHGGWQWLAIAIVVLQFVLPFLMLLSRDLKQRSASLAGIATLIFVMQFFYFFWTVFPAFHPGRMEIHWMDMILPLAIGGLWCTTFIGLARRRLPQLIVIGN